MTPEPSTGIVSGEVHLFPIRVYFEDTDAGGVVYHANYLQFAERARTEMLRSIGFAQSRLAAQTGVFFVMRRCVADFLVPARLDDHLVVASRLVALRGASLDLDQTVMRDGLELARFAVKLACMSQAGRAVRMPSAVRAAFAAISGNFWSDDGK